MDKASSDSFEDAGSIPATVHLLEGLGRRNLYDFLVSQLPMERFLFFIYPPIQ